MKKATAKKNLFDIIEGFYLARALVFLNKAGYFSGGTKNKPGIKNLESLLQVLYDNTDIIKKQRGGHYVLSEKYAAYPSLGFHIDKLLQAYGHIVPGKNKFRLAIDEQEFADAYKKVYPFQNWQFLLDMIANRPVHHLLDIGCGTGKLAVEFCKLNKNNTATGIDAGKHICSTARSFIKKENCAGRAKVYCARAELFHKVLPQTVIAQTEILTASNLLNEFFSGTGEGVVTLLKKLKKYFPGRPMLVVDYYGILGTPRSNDPELRHNYVHDMLQLFSEQGVPPANYKQWRQLYRRAGCTLESVTEGRSQGVQWFVHELRL